mmetsp:Transcript_123804/g.361471  ORF Transcript_123804/g.361471 Transcript_123804/m.361471 type:complete len:185 (-) Transcript_123804:33-587(-)
MMTICEPGNQHRQRAILMEHLSSSDERMQKVREKRLAELYYGWPPFPAQPPEAAAEERPPGPGQPEQGGEVADTCRPSSSSSSRCRPSSRAGMRVKRAHSDPSLQGLRHALGSLCAPLGQAPTGYMHARPSSSHIGYTDLRKKMMADFQELGGHVPVYNTTVGQPDERRRTFHKCRAPLTTWYA